MLEKLKIIEGEFLVEKFPGKGGWTYVKLDVVLKKEWVKSGWTKVKGIIAGHEIEGYKIAPMGKGLFMLPLKADLRKKTNIKEGDKIYLTLEYDPSTLVVPEELMDCLEHFSKAKTFFLSMTEANQKYYIDWISESKTDETKVNRINRVIDRLLEGKRMYDV